jgi:hypothetical protein
MKKIVFAVLGAMSLSALAVGLWPTAPRANPTSPAHQFSAADVNQRFDLGPLPPGSEIALKGFLRSGNDGAVFDAATRTQRVGTENVTMPGGLFDLERTGLRVTFQDPSTHDVRLTVTGADAPACRALGMSGPCLLPKTKELAFERLLTESEFAGTLSGTVDIATPKVAAMAVPGGSKAPSVVALVGAAGLLAFAAGLARKRKNQSVMGQIAEAARAARAATKGSAALGEVHKRIGALCDRANTIEQNIKDIDARLGKLDKNSLYERQAQLKAKADEAAQKALVWVEREMELVNKLERERDAGRAGLDRVLSALRVVELKARDAKGPDIQFDEVDEVERELAIQAEAEAELDHAFPTEGQRRV